MKRWMLFLIAAIFTAVPALALAQGEVELPQTGQTTSYDTGDDGDLQEGVEWPSPRFTFTYCNATGPCTDQGSDCDSDASTDVVTDDLTGLMLPRDGNLDGTKTWSNAISYANGLNLCGYDDWRLPNVNELESLLHAGEENTATWLSGVGFTNVQADMYWSSTSFPDPNVAWVAQMLEGVSFLSGLIDSGKTSNNYVWPVRAVTSEPAELWKTGQTTSYAIGDDGDLERGVAWPSPRFAENGNGTVTDNLTGLVWLKDANCFGEKQWSFALSDANNLADGQCGLTDGSSTGDWHLPNRKELRSLSDYSQWEPALPSDHPFVNVQNSGYWSSTHVAGNPNEAWFVHMQYPYMQKSGFARYIWPVRVGILSDSDISVTKSDDPNPVFTSGELTYTVTITNNGPDDATGVTLSDTLPGGVFFDSATFSQGDCSEASGVVTCFIGDMTSGAFETVTIVVTAPDVEGAITNTATVNSTSNDSDPGNNTATEETTVIYYLSNSDIAVTKSGDPDPVFTDSGLTYTVTITNIGPDAATEVVLVDTLPETVTFLSVASSQGTCSEAGGVVTCDIGDMISGASDTVTIIVTAPDTIGTITNIATVDCTSNDPVTLNNAHTEYTDVQLSEPSIEETIDFFEQGVEDGTLEGSSWIWWGWWGQTQINIMRRYLTTASYYIERGWIGAACFQLRRAYLGCDGEGYDWVVGEDAEELAQMIYDLALSLDCWWTGN